MTKLNGKRIKINGKKFTVSDHMSNVDGNIETIILTRPIRKSDAAPARTLQELGYTCEDDVIYTDVEMEVGDIQIKEKIGSTIMITMILDGDVLKDTKLEIIGPNWSHPNLIDIKFLSESDVDVHEIGRELLISSYLLYEERNNKFIPNKEERRSSPDEDEAEATGLDGLLKDLSGLLGDVIGDKADMKSEHRESPEDLLTKILGSRSDTRDRFKSERETENFSIEEIEIEDAPDEIQRLIKHLRSRNKKRR